MNISDHRHKENIKELLARRSQGYEITVTADGYSVRKGALFVCGASVRLPREKPLHWKHAEANRRDNLASALCRVRDYGRKV